MKRSFVSLALGLAFMSSIFASSGFTPIATLDQARLYCPAENALSFQAKNPGPTSAGTISGVNQKTFTSFPGEVPRPNSLNQNNIIGDAKFRNEGNSYGYISNGTVTCFYSYKASIGSQYALILRSK